MIFFKKILIFISQYDFINITNKNTIIIFYGVLCILLILENAFLPAAFLPGDTLLILSGALISKGTILFFPTIIIFTCATSLGCWLGFLQGRWLAKHKIIQGWIKKIPEKYYLQTNNIINKQGLYGLLIAKFLPFVRTITPIIAGLSTINNKKFHFINLSSSILWNSIIITISYIINQLTFIKQYEHIILNILIFLPIILLFTGLISLIFMYLKYHKKT